MLLRENRCVALPPQNALCWWRLAARSFGLTRMLLPAIKSCITRRAPRRHLPRVTEQFQNTKCSGEPTASAVIQSCVAAQRRSATEHHPVYDGRLRRPSNLGHIRFHFPWHRSMSMTPWMALNCNRAAGGALRVYSCITFKLTEPIRDF